jgi:AraC-like DNA-binding protein
MIFRLDTNAPLLHLPKAESDALRKALKSLPGDPFSGGDRIRAAFKRLFQYYDDAPKGVRRTLNLRGAVLDLLLTLLDAAQRTDAPTPSRVRLEKIIQLIRDEPERDYPSGWLAREAALSDSLINMQFKKLTGLPPHAFLISCRLSRALQLLTTTDTSITELASQFKFSSSQHFAAHFRRFYGITPSEARQGKKPYRGL